MTLVGDWFKPKEKKKKKIGTCYPRRLWRPDTVSIFKKEVDKLMDKKSRNSY